MPEFRFRRRRCKHDQQSSRAPPDFHVIRENKTRSACGRSTPNLPALGVWRSGDRFRAPWIFTYCVKIQAAGPMFSRDWHGV